MIARKIVFVDAQGWMAIVNQRDQCHSAAAEAYKKLGSLGWSFYTSNWAEYDALSHIRERDKNGGLRAARELDRVVAGSKQIIVFPVSPAIERRAVDFFWSMDDKAWSISVCANLQLISDAEINFILSATKAYEEAGKTTLIQKDASGQYCYYPPPVF